MADIVTETPPRWRKLARKIRRAILRDEPTYYDMFKNPGEQYFARLYLHEIQRIFRDHDFKPPLKVLEAGCQTGRLAIPLSRAGHEVTGVDTSGLALRRCRRHAHEAGRSLRLIRADLARWLPNQARDSFDVVICNEVLYLRSNYRLLLEGLLSVLRPGGLCFISHRPTSYYLVEAFQRGDSEAARLLLTAKEGTVGGSYYNWQEPEELQELYRSLSVDILAIIPIGLFSWLAANPEKLGSDEQELLFKADLAAQKASSSVGRYLLVSGKKR